VSGFDWSIRVPFRYSTSYVTLRHLESVLLLHYHPEYIRRLLAWLHYKDGRIGVGGDWRAGGSQPGLPGFAPEGKSFHQDQVYADGFVGACAVDLVVGVPGKVHRAPFWSEVPAQGSSDAKPWGVHCNIATEAWHMQPVEIDGWLSWWSAGRPAPRPGYPIPAEHDPYHVPTTPEVPNMAKKSVVLTRFKSYADVLEGSHTSQQTMDYTGLKGARVVVLDDPTAEQKAAIEAELGHPLTRL
jgi:hypothetical protein